MSLASNMERLARCEALREGIGAMLLTRFGEEALKELMPAIADLYVPETLRIILKTLITATSLDEVRRFCAPPDNRIHRPFITNIERSAKREGMREGIESLLRCRFGEEGLKLVPDIREIYEEERLRTILRALETASSPEEVRRLWTTQSS
jgi:hypothetical protein